MRYPDEMKVDMCTNQATAVRITGLANLVQSIESCSTRIHNSVDHLQNIADRMFGKNIEDEREKSSSPTSLEDQIRELTFNILQLENQLSRFM